MTVRALARTLPFPLRVELARLRRLPMSIVETPTIARKRLPEAEWECFPHLLAHHTSPLERAPGAVEPRLQQGKERNVGIAAGRIDGLVIQPHERFSYHRAVGRPSRWRGETYCIR